MQREVLSSNWNECSLPLSAASPGVSILLSHFGSRLTPEDQPSGKKAQQIAEIRCVPKTCTLALRFQFRIMSEDPVHVEWQAPFRGEISRDVRPLRYTVMKGHEAGNPGLEPRHHLRKGVA